MATRPDAAAALADRLHSAAIHLLRRVRHEDDAAGLPAPHLSVLSVIVFAGPITLGELAKAEQVRPPTITRAVATLERQALVIRQAAPGDRRVARVRATNRGVALLQEGRRRRVASLAATLGQLSADEQSLLEKALPLIEHLARPEQAPS